jgi:hypothetical protein
MCFKVEQLMNFREWPSVVVVGILLLCGAGSDGVARTYTTDFPGAEDPISEGGYWMNGRVAGLDWSNCATAGGMIQGRQNNGQGPNYNDSVAILTGTWGSNQTVTATLYRGTVNEDDWPEAELHVHMSLSAHVATGYEILYSLKTDSSTYIGVVRWNGAFGDFTPLVAVHGSQYVATNGSTLKATIVGGTITTYLNGVAVLTNVDTTFTSGAPGVGFDHNWGSADDSTFGFTTFTATDGMDAPVIVSQPVTQVVGLGSIVSFSVVATGADPLSYQWYFNSTSAIPGATNSVLGLGNILLDQIGGYSVVITNAAGAVTSAVAQLTFAAPPSISSQPSDQTAVAGSNADFKVSAAGTPPLGYQWFFGGTIIAGATTTDLSLVKVQPAQAGGYSVVVTNVAGAITSAVAQLTVLVPPSITRQPGNQSAAAGGNVSFDVVATGTSPLSYQWYFQGNSIAGATTSGLSLTNVQTGLAGAYNVVVTNVAGAITSAVAQLTVAVAPGIVGQPIGQTAVPGGSANFQATATGTTPLSYQWLFGGSVISGATTSSLVLTNVQAAQAGFYSVVVTNSVGSVTSAVAQLTVLVPPSISIQPTNQAALTGASTSFSVNADGTQPLSYQWLFNAAPLAGATNNTLSLTNVHSNQAGAYSAVVTNTAGSITSVVAILTILVPPTITKISLAGATVSLTLDSVAGLNYMLEYKDALSSPSWISLPPGMPGTGRVLTFQYTNAARTSGFYRIQSY